MLAQEGSIGGKKENATVKRAAFNHADYQVDRIRAGGFAQGFNCRTGDFHGAFKVALEIFASFVGARTDDGAKVEATRIAGDERLRKEHQLGALPGGVAGKIESFFQGALAVKSDRCGLHHGDGNNGIRGWFGLGHTGIENYTGNRQSSQQRMASSKVVRSCSFIYWKA